VLPFEQLLINAPTAHVIQVSGYATNQASGIESVNTSALLAIYPSEYRASTGFLERTYREL